MGYIAKNNARSQLAGTLLIAGTTATLDAGDGALFAVTSPEWTYATFFDGSGNIEHVKVTARATDALTIVRAQDGTAAREWPVGTYIECRPIAAAMADYAVAPQINGATAETSIADADEVGFVDASASNVLKKITWANVVATLKAYFDTLYRAVTGNVTLAAGAAVVFEGATDDAHETTLTATDPTADRTITLPDKSGTVAMLDDIPTVVIPQIQPISASVAANALTISASALSLDFRSATLGSGTVTTVSGTPANLVISSGSTLGTVSGQQSRIAVLALNNSGTIELAVVNIAGGNDLTETGVISTTAEGGAGAADSASVVYSTTARSNLAYRVLGYIESTQATAGTWATAPSTIQGNGGQAQAMSGLGYGQTWQSLTGSRAVGVTYYNTTGRPICVSAGITVAAAGVPGITLSINGAVHVAGLIVGGGNISGVFGIIPPGASYSINGNTTPTLSFWSELR